MTEDIGPAHADELDELAKIWHDAWHFAHDDIVDPELVAVRTLALFRERIEGQIENTICARLDGTPVGLAILKGKELHQFFLAEEGRGTGIAYRLMEAAMARFATAGIQHAHLYVARDNDRAIAFYKRTGWTMDKEGFENIHAGGRSFNLPVLIMGRTI